MSVKEGLAESFLRGGTFGLSDLLGVTGHGGLIHDGDDDPENQAVLVDDDGVYFIESKIQIGWDDVVEIAEVGDNTIYKFELRGGLIFFTGWIAGELEDYLESPSCTDVDLCDIDSDDISSENCAAVRTGVTNLLWSIDLASKIRGASHLAIDEQNLLRCITFGYSTTRLFMISGFDQKKNAIKAAIRVAVADADPDKFKSFIKDQVYNLGMEDEADVDEATQATVGGSFYWIYGWPDLQTGDGIDRQKEVYDTLRSARSWGYDVGESATAILTSEEDEDEPLGADSWINHRKMIVCTDERSSLSTLGCGMKIGNVMIMEAQDIIAYNEVVEDEFKIRFESNHPQNGVTYIQHPIQKNTYLSIETYHATLLERKYEELKHLLTCLGATSLELTTESSSTRDEKRSSRRKIDADASVDGIGEISGGFSSADQSARMAALCKTLSTKRVLRPQGKPYIPEDLEFYPTEQGWQRLAKLVIDGRIKSEEVSLTYRNESAISGNTLRNISAKLHSLVPGYSFGVGGNFESEYESELKSLESLTWNYNVQFGDASEKRVDDEQVGSYAAIKSKSAKKKSAPKEDSSNQESSLNKAEQLFLKRARRYAQSEGHIDSTQRADLEAFAQKYGIDDFRMEELIEKAFE